MTQELTNVLLAAGTLCALAFSIFVFVIQRRDRRRSHWWAIVDDSDDVEVGKAIAFRTYKYIGKEKPKRSRVPYATVIRGPVLRGESLIGRERMDRWDAVRQMQDRSLAGEKRPDVPDEVFPPKITMVPEKVIRYKPTWWNRRRFR